MGNVAQETFSDHRVSNEPPGHVRCYVIPDTFRFWVLRASKRTVPECLKNLHVTFRTLSVLIVLRHPAPLEVGKARSRYARTRPVCKPSRAFNSRIGGCAGPPGARSQKSRNWLRVAVAGAARHEGSNPRCHIHLRTLVRAGKVSGCAACRPYRLIRSVKETSSARTPMRARAPFVTS